MRRLLPFLLGLCLLAPAWAENDFDTALQALKEGRDQEALAACQRLESGGKASFGSLYNEGLALRNLGDVPRARAAFERALILSPHDISTRKRLREIDNELGEKVISHDVMGTPWLSTSEIEVLVLLPGLIMVALAVSARIKGVRPPATPMLGLFLGGIAVLAIVAWTSPAKERAVVVDQGAKLLAAPEPGNPGETVPAGSLVDINEHSDHYLKVRLGDGKTGWLRAAQVEQITLPNKAVAVKS